MSKKTDRDKFVNLAEKRVNKTIKYIRLIGNLSNRTNYKYTEKDATQIYEALQRALTEMKSRFERKGNEKKDEFKLE